MTISFCLIAFNEAKTLRASLDHLYPHAHEIIICEGSIALLRESLDLPVRSNDGTCELLESYPDPARKLRIIQREWRDKDEMSAAYAERASGDLIWHVDADEFYDGYSLQAIPREFDDRALNALIVPHVVFWKTPDWVLATAAGDQRWCRVPRVLRAQVGMSVRHIPVRRVIDGVADETGMREPRDPKINTWHYAWNDDSRVRTKMGIYSTRDAKTTRPGWIVNVWDRWTPDCSRSDFPEGVHPAKALRLWPEPYRGQHPACVSGILGLLDASRQTADPQAQARGSAKSESQAKSLGAPRVCVCGTDCGGLR